MKKRNIYSVILFLILLINLCTGCDSYAYIRPQGQRHTIWISKDPSIIYIVEDNITTLPKCWMMVNEEKVFLDLAFDFGTNLYIHYLGEEHIIEKSIMSGSCKFKRNSFIVKIEEDKLFDNKYDKIIFYKLKDFKPEDIKEFLK